MSRSDCHHNRGLFCILRQARPADVTIRQDQNGISGINVESESTLMSNYILDRKIQSLSIASAKLQFNLRGQAITKSPKSTRQA